MHKPASAFRTAVIPLLVALLLLAGCQSDSGPVNLPAELTGIDSPIAIQQKWRRDTRAQDNLAGYQFQPLIVDGLILTIDSAGTINALDRNNGARRWTHQSGLKAGSGLGLSGELIVATSLDGQVVAFRQQSNTLQQVWSVDTSSEIRVAAVGDGELVFVRAVDGKLYGFDSASGEERWVVARRVPALSLTGGSLPLIDGDRIYTGYEDGKIVAIERISGDVLWERSISAPSGRTEVDRLRDIDGNFVLRNNILYVATFQGQLAALQAGSGDLLWVREFSSYLPIDADSQSLYLVSDNSHVWAIDRRTGSALWKQEGLQFRKLTGPLLIGNRIVVTDFEGYVHWLDAGDGDIIGRRKALSNRSYVQPQQLDNTALVSDANGVIVSLQAPQNSAN